MTHPKLSRVHEALADWCLEVLAAKDPETGKSIVTPAEASVIRAFLKDNEITASVEDNDKMRQLREKLEARRKAMPMNPALDNLGDGLMQ